MVETQLLGWRVRPMGGGYSHHRMVHNYLVEKELTLGIEARVDTIMNC